MTKLAISLENRTYRVELDPQPAHGGRFVVRVNGRLLTVELPDADAALDDLEWLIVDGRPYEIVFDDDLRWLQSHGGNHALEIRDLEVSSVRPRSSDGRVKAPIPGLITQVLVTPDQAVEMGEAVVVLEAMKMENEIHAATSGRVVAIHVTPGQSVMRNDVLIEIQPSP